MSDQPVIVSSANKTGKVQAIEIMLLVSGILNILAGLSAVCGALVTIVGVVCLPVVALPLALGIFEVIYASNLLSGKLVLANNIKTVAIFEIATILYGNVITFVVGILNLVFLDDHAVKEYLG
jgi:hypothetical protein